MSAWVGIPAFAFNAPEPVLIGKDVDRALAGVRKIGFKGDNIFIAAHSLGGVMAQNYVGSKAGEMKGAILMGSVLLRSARNITADGSTVFHSATPTLTLVGEKDGLMRISRGAEAYWHQAENVQAS